MNLSEPSISCFPNDAFRDRYSLLTKQVDQIHFDADRMQQLQLVDSMNLAIYQSCQSIYGDLLSYFSSSFTVRDVDLLRQALGEEELWAYFVSYGTALGQYYSQMFPERVGRMILDGVVNPLKHRNAESFSQAVSSSTVFHLKDFYIVDICSPPPCVPSQMLYNVTDAFEDGFLRECLMAGPTRCALAQDSFPSESNEDQLIVLKGRIYDLLETIKTKPLSGNLPNSGPSILTYSTLIDMIFKMLYEPAQWHEFARLLSDLEKGNSTSALMKMEKTFWAFHPETMGDSEVKPKPQSLELTPTIVCNDAYLDRDEEPRSLKVWAEVQKNMMKV